LLCSWKTGFFAGFAIHPVLHYFGIYTKEITKQSSQPDRLHRSGSSGDVLCLTSRQSHHLLLDRLLADETLAEEEHRPLVLLLVSMSPAWSLSLQPMKCAASGHLG
jgi:hypothetical protein